MRRSLRWPLAGVVGVMVAVSLLVIPALGQGPVTGEVGVLRLHLNSDGDRFVFDPSTGPDLTQTLSETNCKLASSGDSLVSLVGSSSHSSKMPFPGLKDHRIGVGQKFEGTGEPCARINKDLGQKLTIGVAGAIADTTLGYAEIDLGFKYNGSAELELRKDGLFVDKVTVPCTGGSDCGPDSGKSDNERVILWFDPSDDPGAGHWQSFQIDGVFDTIVIKPISSSYKGKSAAVSLEGGFNGAAPGPLGTSLGTSDTLFKVVGLFDGEIDCGDTVNLGEGDATTQITRGNDAVTGCKGPEDGLLFDFESGVEEGRLFVDFVTAPVDGSAVAQFLEVITWTFDDPPAVPGEDQFRTLSYDDHVGAGERVMPWCVIDPRVGGALPASLDPATVLPPAPEGEPVHTSCLIEATSVVTLFGDFVEVNVVYNIADGRRWRN
jgi:hypothetical protein